MPCDLNWTRAPSIYLYSFSLYKMTTVDIRQPLSETVYATIWCLNCRHHWKPSEGLRDLVARRTFGGFEQGVEVPRYKVKANVASKSNLSSSLSSHHRLPHTERRDKNAKILGSRVLFFLTSADTDSNLTLITIYLSKKSSIDILAVISWLHSCKHEHPACV